MTFRPKYITFDCYGTLTRFRMKGERDLDAAIRHEEARCRKLESGRDLLEQHIVETQRLAAAARIFDQHL